MIRQVNKKNQLTLPPGFLKEAGIAPGGYVALQMEGRRIVLKPVRVEEDDFTREELDDMEQVIHSQIKKKKYSRRQNRLKVSR